MDRLAIPLCVLLLWLASLAGAQTPPLAAAEGKGNEVVLLSVDGAIDPASADYIGRGLQRAARRGASLVVLQLDTPGGLETSMRAIIKAILASAVPVATFVAPSGARAASAGTFILYGSHVAAMAPATALGAATPVMIGLAPSPLPAAAPSGLASGDPTRQSAPTAPRDALEAKRINDAAAAIRSLALLRHRNADWAERAVRDAVSLSAAEALPQHVVDILASDLPDLLRQLDGRAVPLSDGRTVTLATAGARVERWDPDWRDRLLAVVGDPSIAMLLLLIGFYGLVFEFSSPGLVAPGVAGLVCLLLALFGLQALPLNGAGLALVLLGLACFAGEAFAPSHGALGVGGIAAFTFGALMLIDSDTPGVGVSRPLIAVLALTSLALVGWLGTLTTRLRGRPPASGASTMVGLVGEVLEADGQEAWALLQGERWRVRTGRALRPGERVRVLTVDGLTLGVAVEDTSS
ncbi:MAG: nodulation protein NfeD [Burkholderiaceae bacterium]|nr:nodulation protein NfeD [Roseateles sp.]MBV8469937.1 nodulation protein NfeD [Burkholderiaceae bacterium]